MIAHHKDWLGLVTGMWMNMNESEPKVLWPHAFLDILFIPCHFSFMTQDLDPRMVCWKGAAILACLDTTQEMWITQREWKQFSVRMLRERAPFMWWKRRAAIFLKQCHKSRDVAFFLLSIHHEGRILHWLIDNEKLLMFREGRLCNVFTSEMYITPCGKNLLELTSGKLNSSQS